MTFIELCKRVRADAGISGDIASVTGQQGIMAKLVTWVQQADLDIQRMPLDWQFMWHQVSPTLQIGVREYLPADLNIQSVRKSLSMQLGKGYLSFIPWDVWQVTHALQPSSAAAKPTGYTRRPDGKYLLDHLPDQAYQLVISYFRKPVTLQGNTAVSVIPEEFHEAIVQRALYFYAKQEEDQYLMETAKAEYNRLVSEMAVDYLPKMTINFGGIH